MAAFFYALGSVSYQGTASAVLYSLPHSCHSEPRAGAMRL